MGRGVEAVAQRPNADEEQAALEAADDHDAVGELDGDGEGLGGAGPYFARWWDRSRCRTPEGRRGWRARRGQNAGRRGLRRRWPGFGAVTEPGRGVGEVWAWASSNFGGTVVVGDMREDEESARLKRRGPWCRSMGEKLAGWCAEEGGV